MKMRKGDDRNKKGNGVRHERAGEMNLGPVSNQRHLHETDDRKYPYWTRRRNDKKNSKTTIGGNIERGTSREYERWDYVGTRAAF